MKSSLTISVPAALFLSWLFCTSVAAEQTTPPPAAAATEQPQAASPYNRGLQGAEVIGTGSVTAYRKDDHILLALPKNILGRLLLWYSEAVRLPSAAVSQGGLNTGPKDGQGATVITLERQGQRLFIRDNSPSYNKRSGIGAPAGSGRNQALGETAIHRSVSNASNGPIMAVLPILGDGPAGEILVDITEPFSKDIEALTARGHIISTGLIPAAVDPARSYIADIKVFPTDVNIRSHLTFLATDPNDPVAGPQPVSIEIGHSIILLPEEPMQARYYDERVGFYTSKFTEYETREGGVLNKREIIIRRRLEKKDPSAKVSDPVQPIVFYIGQGVPARWRPYLRAAVEQWQPILEAAGFSNAIIARDAPSPEEDPIWSAEDARHSVIRWISQEFSNAMGPVVYDPRSGEILSSHILIWPGAIRLFERYYYSVAGTVDPEADSLPLSDAKRGELLTYVVAHEVGHTLGLRHNQLASTVYTVEQLRDAEFANSHGPNTSIMAYGRFNQCAQPGDGVTRLYSVLGPYDYFAIDWGYGVHGATSLEEQAILDRMAAESETDRRIAFGVAEDVPEIEKWGLDPRIQLENTGAERIEATRLGVANLLRSLAALNQAVGDNDKLFAETYQTMLGHHVALVSSVKDLVGGQFHLPGHDQGLNGRMVPAARQREAVKYLLGEGALSLEAYKKPEVLYRAQSFGGVRAVEAQQMELVNKLLSGSTLAVLEEQKSVDPAAYGVMELADDITATLWGDITGPSHTRKLLQTAFLDRVAGILRPQASDKERAAAAAGLAKTGFSPAFIDVTLATGAKTSFPAWAYATLPELLKKLKDAGTTERSGQIHYQEMARRIREILTDR